MPAVSVTISEGSNIFIRITDQGGGVAHAAENKVLPRPHLGHKYTCFF